MAQYDLVSKLTPYFDRHLAFPLLEFLQEKNLYGEESLNEAKLVLLEKTNMVDYASDIYMHLHKASEAPQYLKDRREEVVARLKHLQSVVEPLLKCLQNSSVVKNFRQDRSYNIKFLNEQFDVTTQHIDLLYQYAKFQYECGNYSLASELLQSYKSLCPDSNRLIEVQWGKLASELLLNDMDRSKIAREDLQRLRESIDNMDKFQIGQQNQQQVLLQQLQQRTWLLHWSLHAFWIMGNDVNDLLDLFLHPAYLPVIQINAQHLLRYLAVACVLSPKRRSMLKEVLNAVQLEAYQYRDPATEFLECVFLNYDFDGAQQKLKECEVMLDNDYFLYLFRDDFMQCARRAILEAYCRIHRVVSIKLLADRLGMDVESAEKWVASLISEAKFNAKIDSKSQTVVMGVQGQSAYEQLAEKAKVLSARTYSLANQVIGTSRA
eukprot:CAMPEP_0175087290 /NCGR_PEP_ID=MMETSP0052_2-20121109/29747_1 /TAXON_ID=51329 ORGANISM="Polytomella parva, Strain SAG 63-3" /NCGR_SAMPLE_ID=MMETSP0052_2 /ASSEMBLY_ACC=CAM_ASM_000194 /LENGTH=434 /DNA_ID=CAMNT_0016359617 /DNA_START=9 /DNA_END=1313 /DNA_ORIENTATION=+